MGGRPHRQGDLVDGRLHAALGGRDLLDDATQTGQRGRARLGHRRQAGDLGIEHQGEQRRFGRGEVEVAGRPATQPLARAGRPVGGVEAATQLLEPAGRQLAQELGLVLVVVVHRPGGDAGPRRQRPQVQRLALVQHAARLADQPPAQVAHMIPPTGLHGPIMP